MQSRLAIEIKFIDDRVADLPSIWTDRRNHDAARSWVMADAVVRDFQTAKATTIRAAFRMEQVDAPVRAYDQQNEARTA